jgi:hypothetical protein
MSRKENARVAEEVREGQFDFACFTKFMLMSKLHIIFDDHSTCHACLCKDNTKSKLFNIIEEFIM